MSNLDIQHFQQLKSEIQEVYLQTHTPSETDISQWKGIDIIYFQEDLRKKAKGNISEKSFYTYFKAKQLTKIPRIDMLNVLSKYAGYASWYEFKKAHLFENEVITEEDESDQTDAVQDVTLDTSTEINETGHPEFLSEDISDQKFGSTKDDIVEQPSELHQSSFVVEEKEDLQKSTIDNQSNKLDATKNEKIRTWWYVASFLLLLIIIAAASTNKLFESKYTYCFIDEDRNMPVQSVLDIKVFKENESPLFFRINPGECFTYSSPDKILKMEISSPLYENLLIQRNLENAPEEEKIRLNPDDYKTAVYYYSKKDITGLTETEKLNQIKKKRRELENRISNNAQILQIFDNDIYGIETLDKQKYINLVTTPTTSLKNLSFIEIRSDKGKIVSIKFKIKEDEIQP